MSFPYFDDNIINNIRSNLHDEIGNLTQTIEFEARDFRDIQLKFNFEPPKVEFKFLNNYLLGISDTKQISGIPEYDEKDILEQAEIHKEWVYWVIENIANLNYDFTIPFKLLDLLVQNPHFNKYLQFKVYKQDKSSDFTVDNRFTVDDKAVPFLIQQCLARSSTEKNKAISEFSVYGENYINNIITIIPYLLFSNSTICFSDIVPIILPSFEEGAWNSKVISESFLATSFACSCCLIKSSFSF